MNIEVLFQILMVKVFLINFNFFELIDEVLIDRQVYWIDFFFMFWLYNVRVCYIDYWDLYCFESFGDIYLIFVGYVFYVWGDQGGYKVMICLLFVGFEGCWFENKVDWMDCYLEISFNICNGYICSLLLCLGEEVQYFGFVSEVLVELIVG